MPRQPRTNFTLKAKVKELLKEQAEEENRTVSSLLNHIVTEYLKTKGKFITEKKE